MRKLLIIPILGLLMAPAAFADTGGKPSAACDQQYQQCSKQCDKKKTMWFFKGTAYQSCADKCDARKTACASAGQKAADMAGAMDKAGDQAKGGMDKGKQAMQNEHDSMHGAMDKSHGDMKGEHGKGGMDDQESDDAHDQMAHGKHAMDDMKGEMKDKHAKAGDMMDHGKKESDSGDKEDANDDDNGGGD